ncbi:MAG: M23 family metallopeptidase [Saprospiraceae bacterium]|nr:M23 family metallopeptidase [Saprospiraceae bacterium]
MASKLRLARKWLEQHLEKRFLLIIRNEETFEEKASYRLTLKNLYILSCSVVLAGSVLLFLLISFTPLKRYIPGYGDIYSRREFIELEQQIASLERSVAARDTYLQSVQRILEGRPETKGDVARNVQIHQVKPEVAPKIPEDSLLRAGFETALSRERGAAASRVKTQARLPAGEMTAAQEDLNLSAPLRGPIGADYHPESGHLGVDIMAAKNTPIKAVMDGTVIQSDWSVENGHTIALQHGNNLVSMYKHNSALLKRTGARVKAGEAIAIVGNTGTLTDGPHLHFELWFGGRPVNPSDYILF